MPSCILRLPQVLERVGFSRSTLLSKVGDGTFPEPLFLSTRARGWLESDVEAWIESRIQQRDGGQIQTATV